MVKRLFPLLLFFVLAVVALLSIRGVGGVEPDGSAMAARTAPAVRETATPRPPGNVGPRRAILREEDDGHFWASAKVNGVSVRFMVDSGASVIALTERDARRVGLDMRALPRTASVATANGRVKAGWTKLDSVRIGGVEVDSVEAVVIEEGLEHSLLGMSFLSRLESWQVASGAMTLRQ